MLKDPAKGSKPWWENRENWAIADLFFSKSGFLGCDDHNEIKAYLH